MKALTICQPIDLDSLAADGFGHWVAGFIDGEGCFYITEGQGSHRCVFRLKLRADDGPILHEIVRRTGLGYVKEFTPRSARPQCEWYVVSKSDAAAPVRFLERFPLRAKKSRDFAIWRAAVDTHSRIRIVSRHKGTGKINGTVRDSGQVILATLKRELMDVRTYR
ncbi:MAG: LAGLIDADG family homing endonuclease [Terriglobia bacterium]|nr:LAGLIDADG family homing endonuclease [Terriglobia bacterium]